MAEDHQSSESLVEQLELLRLEVNELKTSKAAAEAQRELLENLVAMARSQTEEQMLTATLKKTLDVCTRLTDAERGSLFLYDSNGAISASLLTRKDATAEYSTQLIGIVLDKGLAGWVSRNREIGLIIDTQQDDRWVELLNQPYIVRSALAVPILRGQELLGLLTLLHSKTGHFSNDHAHLMQVTADQIALVLENADLYAKLDESHSSLEKAKNVAETYLKALRNELDKGKQIQRNFLPDYLPEISNWEIAASFYPARDVAGDFYDAFLLPGDYVGLVIADVCDKGVGAALFMALFRSLIRVFSGQTLLRGFAILDNAQEIGYKIDQQIANNLPEYSALKAIELTNNYIAQTHFEMSMFATMFFGILNPATGMLTYINGGHEPPIILSSNREIKRLAPTGPAVGMMPDMNFKIQQFQLKRGDILLTYTDGVPEARSPNGDFFTEKRLLSLLEQLTCSATELLKNIETRLQEHIADRDQFDDITMLAVRWTDIEAEGAAGATE